MFCFKQKNTKNAKETNEIEKNKPKKKRRKNALLLKISVENLMRYDNIV